MFTAFNQFQVKSILLSDGFISPKDGVGKINSLLHEFNYYDKVNADLVFKSNVRIDVISNLNSDNAMFDLSMYNSCRQSRTLLAKILYNVHSQNVALEKLKQNHFRLCDELVVIYLTNPELFGINIMTDKLNVRYNKDYNVQGVKEAISDMIIF